MVAHDIIVSLSVFVPVPIATGWAWGKCEDQFPAVEEALADMAELPRLLRSYGRAVSQVIRPKLGGRFNVTAFDVVTGSAIGRDQWAWDAEFKVFRAHGEPWAPLMKRARLMVVQTTPLALIPTPQPGPYMPLRVAA
ncbi:hypothetical protein PP629_gp40 [Streptomyces phage Dubu]|uniref:Uncharacterized protein n=1 Tax=Streptomyces phage Dubu TaxID=2591226 RepID=A0A514DEW1_9CAUD|nr:hypothetical protein PP629_gp40 [Streptomyces phage Dubu]QDH92145.1 hypothetical protein SEA_DUBU_40 [Streptomyces phage Dubu]